MEYVLDKPPGISGYDNHRIVAGLTSGKPATWHDAGDHLVIRTEKKLDLVGQTRTFTQGEVIAFQLRASCGKKVQGKHKYFHTSDWRSRHEWLRRKGVLNGFEVITVHCRAEIRRLKNYTVDETNFTGVLKVTDPVEFGKAVLKGIGSTAGFVGFGFISL
jgi:hypothetical protein